MHQQIKYKQQECTEELYQTLKGRLTQELLCRWWYALEWPPANAKEHVRHLSIGLLPRRRTDRRALSLDRNSMVSKSSTAFVARTFACGYVGCLSAWIVA